MTNRERVERAGGGAGVRLDTRETIRRALRYAIGDRESYLHSIAETEGMEGDRTETRKELVMFHKILKRRYGINPIDTLMANATRVCVRSIRARALPSVDDTARAAIAEPGSR